MWRSVAALQLPNIGWNANVMCGDNTGLTWTQIMVIDKGEKLWS